MEFKEFLADKIATFNGNVKSGATDNVGRERAIDWLKQNGYELTESNVQIAIKKISESESVANARQAEINNLLQYDTEQLVDMYNTLVCQAIDAKNVEAVHPTHFVREDEKVLLTFYTFLRLDPRLYENAARNQYSILSNGVIGRFYITDRKIILNYMQSIYPDVSTICFESKNVCSVAITGLYNDEIEIVLMSGQRIKLAVPETEEILADIEKYIFQ